MIMNFVYIAIALLILLQIFRIGYVIGFQKGLDHHKEKPPKENSK